MSHKKFGPDRFSRFDVYWIQTNKQTNKQTDRQAKFIYRYELFLCSLELFLCSFKLFSCSFKLFLCLFETFLCSNFYLINCHITNFMRIIKKNLNWGRKIVQMIKKCVDLNYTGYDVMSVVQMNNSSNEQ